MSSLQIDTGDVISTLALLVAGYSAWSANRVNKRQAEFERTAARLNELLIAREGEEAQSSRSASISANFYKAGKTDYRLKVFNRGKAVARNVRLEIIDGGDLFIKSDVERKFPVPLMEQHASIELIAPVHSGSPPRAHLKFIWDDDTGSGRTGEAFPTW